MTLALGTIKGKYVSSNVRSTYYHIMRLRCQSVGKLLKKSKTLFGGQTMNIRKYIYIYVYI
jgi:hypothetical protein